MFNTPIMYKLNKLFSKKSNTEMDLIWDIVNLLIYNSTKSNDIVHIYNLLGMEKFVQLIILLNGRTIKFPKKEEIEDNLTTSLIYYDKNIKKLTWKEIKAKYAEINISPIKHALKIRKLDEFISMNIQKYFKEMEE